jgi:hypothetical protein
VRATETSYAIRRLDGRIDTQSASSLPLTDMFRPLVLRQSIGPYVRPLSLTKLNLEMRLGFAGRETIAAGQLAVDDHDATPTIEVKELDNIQQAGPDGVITIWGKLLDGQLAYRWALEVMAPVLRHPDAQPGKTTLDLINVDLIGTLSAKLARYASLDYQLKLARQPQLLDETQVSHLMTLTFGVATEHEKKKVPAK